MQYWYGHPGQLCRPAAKLNEPVQVKRQQLLQSTPTALMSELVTIKLKCIKADWVLSCLTIASIDIRAVGVLCTNC